jgi:hypothetical protein
MFQVFDIYQKRVNLSAFYHCCDYVQQLSGKQQVNLRFEKGFIQKTKLAKLSCTETESLVTPFSLIMLLQHHE